MHILKTGHTCPSSFSTALRARVTDQGTRCKSSATGAVSFGPRRTGSGMARDCLVKTFLTIHGTESGEAEG
jgi:hypothetical protein